MRYLPYVILGFLVMIEGSITTLPLVLLFLLFYAVFTKAESVFLIAFIAGVAMDILTLRPFGMSSLFFLVTLFLILLYERKFEISTIYFVSIATFLSSLIYLIIFSSQNVFSQSVSCVILSVIFFFVVQRILTPRHKVY